MTTDSPTLNCKCKANGNLTLCSIYKVYFKICILRYELYIMYITLPVQLSICACYSKYCCRPELYGWPLLLSDSRNPTTTLPWHPGDNHTESQTYVSIQTDHFK